MKIRMKNIIIMLFTCALLALSAGRAEAFIHYTQNTFTTGDSLDPGLTQMGVFFTLGDDYKSFYPAIRYGLGPLFEIGARFGATSADFGSEDKVGGLLGADLKYQVIKQTEDIPVDMALDLGVDNTLINEENATEVTFSTIFSRGFPLTDYGYKLVPYGGLEMTALYGSLITENKTSLYAFAGLEWKLSQKVVLLMEIKTGSSTLGGFGIKFEY
jgi:hypothetical protein